ncbi:sensor histidine kinase [Luteibacter rhizovicinus]|uniref:sensor histidine kinase n=1 Tax=Luteibacter rhizovicinus TaxID=242606 RepID=UPI00140463A6|nr:ATP-binding protein [Luteibacter rhizovicinus]
MINKLWGAMRAWLERVPVTDPVERRNAPFVQVLLIAMGVLMPLNKVIHLYFVSFRDSMTTPGLAMDMVTDVLMMVAAWGCLYLVRRGHFRRAVTTYLGVMLFSATLAYAAIGLDRLSNDPFPLLLLGLGGLVLGRRTLWTVYVVLMFVFCVGTLSDVFQQLPHGSIDWQPGRKVSMALSYLVVAIVLDRTIAALRDSLAESNARGRDLEREMAERERAQGQLVHAQKMEATGRIASGVAHDFDNVLNVVLGYARRRERLADEGTGALVASLEGVELAARRALSISRKLLNFSGQQRLSPEVFDISRAIRDIHPMLRQMFDGDISVKMDVEDTYAPVLLDRGQLELMLLNIAANARDAMPEGGRFVVTLRIVPGAVALMLADNGCGMPDDVARRVFEPFYTTKPVGCGTGLGLAAVYDTVTSAGGEIEVESTPGKGTTFRIRLPLAGAGLAPVVAERVA